MRRRLVALVAAASLLGLGNAYAEELRIGIVRTDRILQESAPMIKAQKKLEKEFASREQELQKVAKQARDLQSQLEKEGVTLPESDRRAKEQELNRVNRDLQRMQRELREDYNLRRNEEWSAVLERVNKVINAIAEQEKYDLILQDAVYVSKRVDITDKVLKALADK
ncbi:MAG: OmpH family outer membrane protein [Betaproteobacteria bacterium]|nr:OmpH family outer membrane protein [Betaproteobacteria bacterium]